MEKERACARGRCDEATTRVLSSDTRNTRRKEERRRTSSTRKNIPFSFFTPAPVAFVLWTCGARGGQGIFAFE